MVIFQLAMLTFIVMEDPKMDDLPQKHRYPKWMDGLFHGTSENNMDDLG